MTGANANLEQRLAEHGLHLRGSARLTADEIEAYGFESGYREFALVGNVGPSYWPEFSQSPEHNDGDPHPLDRWSRRIGQEIAEEHYRPVAAAIRFAEAMREKARKKPF